MRLESTWPAGFRGRIWRCPLSASNGDNRRGRGQVRPAAGENRLRPCCSCKGLAASWEAVSMTHDAADIDHVPVLRAALWGGVKSIAQEHPAGDRGQECSVFSVFPMSGCSVWKAAATRVVKSTALPPSGSRQQRRQEHSKRIGEE